MDLIPFPFRDIKAAADAAKTNFGLDKLRLGFLRTDVATPIPIGVIAWEDGQPASNILVREFKGMTAANIEVIGSRGGKHGIMHAHYDSFGTLEIFHSAHATPLWRRPVPKPEHYGAWREPRRGNDCVVCVHEAKDRRANFSLRFSTVGHRHHIVEYKNKWSWATFTRSAVWDEFRKSYPSASYDGYSVTMAEADLSKLILAANPS